MLWAAQGEVSYRDAFEPEWIKAQCRSLHTAGNMSSVQCRGQSAGILSCWTTPMDVGRGLQLIDNAVHE